MKIVDLSIIINTKSQENRTVLVAEDDLELLGMYDVMLSVAGYRVVCQPDGEAALAFISAVGVEQIDVLITDLMMPRMNGLTLTRNVQDLCARLPIIIATATPNHPEVKKLIKEAAEAGLALGELSKPFDLNDLTGMVEQMLDISSFSRPCPSSARLCKQHLCRKSA